jgi:isopentenyl diphosphate isomerase/L-lactate dehydrogenase-like FMN-dependent dehydrogenase
MGDYMTDDNEKMTLKEVRDNAKDKLKGICGVYKVCDGQPGRLCMGQKYGEPIGMGGAGKGLGFWANTKALDEIKLIPRLIAPHFEPEMKTTIFGEDISFPILSSSLSGVKASMGGLISEFEFACSVLSGARDSGTLGLIGNTAIDGEELTGIKAVENVGCGIPIFKPQSNQRLLELIIMAEKANATAVGVDVDGCGSTVWEKWGKPVYKKSAPDLKELVYSTDLPFIVKGIMCVEDALEVMDLGIAGIDVSNHGGRVLDSTQGVAEVLPDIVKAVKGKVTITAGGGVRTGFDVLKMIALGADGVLIGRDMVRAALGGEAQGVKLHFDYLKSDLRRAMLLANCKNIDDIDGRIIIRPEV